MMQKSSKHNRQVQRTKSYIFEALMLLMDEMPYGKITVSDITEKAGIARTTFYRNYNDKDDVVFEYLLNTFNTELLNIKTVDKDDKQNTIVFMFDYKYMVKHQKTLKKLLSISDIENRIFRELQEFPMSLLEHYKEKLSAWEYLICRYKLCYQIIGCLRVLFDWFINDMPLPVENIVLMLNAMNVPKTVQYRNIPNIFVRLKDE
jgi:AcrR family transcriptional regulator